MSFDKSFDLALFVIIAAIVVYLGVKIVGSWKNKDDLFNWWD